MELLNQLNEIVRKYGGRKTDSLSAADGIFVLYGECGSREKVAGAVSAISLRGLKRESAKLCCIKSYCTFHIFSFFLAGLEFARLAKKINISENVGRKYGTER